MPAILLVLSDLTYYYTKYILNFPFSKYVSIHHNFLVFLRYLFLMIAFNSQYRRISPDLPFEFQNSCPTWSCAAFYLSPAPCNLDQCFTSTRSARGRSLIKLLKDFRRRPRRRPALRFVDSR